LKSCGCTTIRGKGDYRALIDRLWPRGISKSDIDVDEWAKDVAPSSELCKWYGHDPEHFATFARRYRRELGVAPATPIVERLRQIALDGRLTLLTATRELEHSGAVLRDVIVGRRSLGEQSAIGPGVPRTPLCLSTAS
jgi:uncharacterized protein YeaO (DUF488 family)